MLISAASGIRTMALRKKVVNPKVRPKPGNTLGCVFCPTCGVRLYHEPAYGKFLNVKAGTFDDRSWITPVGHIWTDYAQPWVRQHLSGVIYPRQQPSMDAFIAAWRERAQS